MSFFLAVDPNPAVRAEAAALLARLRPRVEAKWQLADKLHVTLVFLGEPDAATVRALPGRLAPVVAAHAPFPLALGGAGVFVTARAPSVLWLGVDGALAPLLALQADLARACGVAAEREYVPHLTLARAKTPGAMDGLAAELAPWRSGEFTAAQVTLYESTHHQYRPCFSLPLGSAR